MGGGRYSDSCCSGNHCPVLGIGNGKFRPPHLENRLTDFEETWNLELSPEYHPTCKATCRCVNVGGLGEHPVCHCKFLSLPVFFPFLFFFVSRTWSHQWTDLCKNWHVSAVAAKNVPFGGPDDDQSRFVVQTPKTQNFGAWIGISSQIYKKNQIVRFSKLRTGLV